jgi:carboxyl-terminal processing protease
VHARIKSDDRSFNDDEMIFGRIDPGQSKAWTTYVKVPKDAPDRIDVLEFVFHDSRKISARVAPLKFRIDAADRPVFAYSHQLIDEGNGDGLVQKGESFRLRVRVRNVGSGEAEDTTALLRNSSGDGVSVKKGRFEVGSLKPDESKEVEFEFDVQDSLREDELVVEMTVYDAVLHEAVVEKLRYPIASASAGPVRASGHVEVRAKHAAIRSGASQQSETVAFAKRGAVFPVTGRETGWIRVRLDADRPGFLSASDVRKTDKPVRPALAANWQVTPPNLSLEVPTLETGMASYRLHGKASDETRIDDVYIFVSNVDAKVDNKKVFYKSNRGGKNPSALDFEADIPLWPGSNRITVVARENSEVRSSKTLYLYRRGDLRAEKAVSEAK